MSPIQKKELDFACMKFDAIMRVVKGNEAKTFSNTLLAEEKQHRKFSGGNNALPVSKSAKLLGLLGIIDYLTNSRPKPDPINIFDFRLSLFQSYSLAATYRMEIGKLLSFDDISKISRLDYAELNNV